MISFTSIFPLYAPNHAKAIQEEDWLDTKNCFYSIKYTSYHDSNTKPLIRCFADKFEHMDM